MSKRPVDTVGDDGNQAYLKRQKIKHVTVVPSETIQSARQLQQLLSFDQDVAKAKHGIQSFKTFLDNLTGDTTDHVSILAEYLESQRPRDNDKTSTYLNDIMQTWSFASQTNNDTLLSSIPVLLVTLYKTLSGRLHFIDYGLQLGRTLLQKPGTELLARNLTANKTKTFVIAPTLSLLREVISFDGGALVKQAFRVREFVLKALPRNLGLRYLGDGIEDDNKPSIRTHAVRLVCSFLKYSAVEAKREFLNQKDVISGIMREINNDPPLLVAEILEALRVYVLEDEKLPRESKSRVLNPANLLRLVTLYQYAQDGDGPLYSTTKVHTTVHEFLVLACTSNEKGVLYRQSGYYPRGIDPDAADAADSKTFINLGLESLDWTDKFSVKVLVRNTTLSEFIQTLRPWSSTKQADLLLGIFRAAPELVADYFFNKKSFTFEPKLTATWIGYASFLFSVVQLPIPTYFGQPREYARLPPPSNIVIENLLPLPLTQKVLTRCLNQSSSLIRFFVVRILIVAFQKLKNLLILYRDAAKDVLIWQQAAHQLEQMFSQRCPIMKDVLIAFKATSTSDLMMRHATSQLLVLYYDVIPQSALESKFDVSAALTEALDVMDGSAEDTRDFAMHTLEVENLFQIAHCSPGMRWFNKADSRPLSPFTTMLRLLVEAPHNVPLSRMRSIIQALVAESGILQLRTAPSSLDALVAALRSSGASSAVFEFIDDCTLRTSTTSVKYIDTVDKLKDENGSSGNAQPVSLLLLSIAEQWLYLVKSGTNTSIESVASFMASYYAASLKIGEDKKVLKSIIKSSAEALPEKSVSRKLIEKCKKQADTIDLPGTGKYHVGMQSTLEETSAISTDVSKAEVILTEAVKLNSNDNGALLRWSGKEIEEVVEDGHLAALLMLLSSPYLSARKEALTNIGKLALKIKESTYEEKEQLWILLCEIVETSRPHVEAGPIPTVISSFAANAVDVLRDPLHCLYPKLNKFLTQGPTWELDRVPLMPEVLEKSPSLDDAYYQEIDWLLKFLANGLQTKADLAIYHKRHVFAKLLSLYNNAYITKSGQEQILRILYQSTSIEGGSSTLLTRFSILGWIDAQIGLQTESTILGVLRRRIFETADEERLQAWSLRKPKELQDVI